MNKQTKSVNPRVWQVEGWKVHRDAMDISDSVIEIATRRRMDSTPASSGCVGDWNNVLYIMAKEFVDLYTLDQATGQIVRAIPKTKWQNGDEGKAAAKEEKSNIIPFPMHKVKRDDT